MLQAQKQLKLEEMVGEGVWEEEEPEGEDTAGPSGEAGKQSSGNVLCWVFFSKFNYLLLGY